MCCDVLQNSQCCYKSQLSRQSRDLIISQNQCSQRHKVAKLTWNRCHVVVLYFTCIFFMKNLEI